ncbi:MAG TPA: hypothetical protein VMU83_09350, partial [Hanamia sp.]|nr:hypothetical protein [Hanamia sp.]
YFPFFNISKNLSALIILTTGNSNFFASLKCASLVTKKSASPATAASKNLLSSRSARMAF